MRLIIYLLLSVALGTGCVQHRQLVTFGEPALGQDGPEDITNAINPTIQPEDLLRIDISSANEEAVAAYNMDNADGGGGQRMMGGAGGQQGGSNQLELFMGYLVDRDGYVDIPGLGRIPAAGSTIEELKADVLSRVSEYVKDAVVNVRYLNFKVTVLGEVGTPGTVSLTNKRATILDALGRSGDLTDYSNREEVLVIREVDGVRSAVRLNLQSPTLFESPYFYLRQNDVIYVEPLPARVAVVADPVQRVFSYASGALSLISIIIALATR